MTNVPSDYYNLLARIESANNPNARASSSTASGLYQFTRATWEGLGGTWGNQSGRAFGGQRVPVSQQREFAERLTTQNAATLSRDGIPINNATLYAAHFLGVTGARKILGADAATPIEEVTSADQRRANPTILKGTVGDFFNWLKRKTGDAVTSATNTANATPQFTPPFTDANSAFGNIARGSPLGDIAASIGNMTEGAGGVGAIAEAAGEAVKEANPMNGVLDFFKNLFSRNTAVRLIVVIIGLLLIGAAIAALAAPQLAGLQSKVLKGI